MNKLLCLSLAIVTLLLFSCAVNEPASAGSVNGKSISKDDFYSSYRGHYTMFSYQNGRIPDNNEKQSIFSETWVNITRSLILRNYYQKYKISTTMREVIDTLSTSIPQHVKVSQAFAKNGKFDKNLYLQSLLTDRPENMSALRKQYQEYLIPNQKLQAKLIERELISKQEAAQIGKILASKADITLNVFSATGLDESISDNEISAYYQAYLPKYRLKPYTRFAYCTVPVIPDEEDYLQSKIIADSIYTQLNSGATAEEIIHARADKTGMLSLIDHGYQKSADIPAEIQNQFLNIVDGTCTSPQREDKGWIIYQKVQSTKTLTLYRSIRIQSLPRSSSLAEPETTAKRIMDLAMSIGLKNAAEEFGVSYLETQRLDPDSLAFEVRDVVGMLNKKLKAATAGSIFEPMYSADLAAWLVIEVIENQTKLYQSLDEVRSAIHTELSGERLKDMNKLSAREWIANPNKQAPNNMQVVAMKNVNAYSSWENQPLTNYYYQALKAHLANTPPPIIELEGKLVVPVSSNQQFSKDKVSAAQIRDTYIKTLPPDWFNQWLDTQVKHAKVVINISR
ncbi:MAG: peptidylprolyl isomerase [Candidatus Cloacimonas sp.]|jgi:sulfur relay (sulfurtransferase) DsrC/TusE family protein|nr:peptidylprolyl isomerase [Candidatus Cloacimonas sp.]